MSQSREIEYNGPWPCLIVVTRDCPEDCHLHHMVEQIVQQGAQRLGCTEAEFVQRLRNRDPQALAQAAVNNRRRGKLTGVSRECKLEQNQPHDNVGGE